MRRQQEVAASLRLKDLLPYEEWCELIAIPATGHPRSLEAAQKISADRRVRTEVWNVLGRKQRSLERWPWPIADAPKNCAATSPADAAALLCAIGSEAENADALKSLAPVRALTARLPPVHEARYLAVSAVETLAQLLSTHRDAARAAEALLADRGERWDPKIRGRKTQRGTRRLALTDDVARLQKRFPADLRQKTTQAVALLRLALEQHYSGLDDGRLEDALGQALRQRRTRAG